MSSSDRLNPQQLQMFMPAKELIDLPFFEVDREWNRVEEGEDVDAEDTTLYNDGFGGTITFIEEDDEQFWDRKLDESHKVAPETRPDGTRRYVGDDEPSLSDDIKESGQVKMPVKLENRDYSLGTMQRIRQGHHRIAAANEINPDMEIPVRHIDDWGQWVGNHPHPNE